MAGPVHLFSLNLESGWIAHNSQGLDNGWALPSYYRIGQQMFLHGIVEHINENPPGYSVISTLSTSCRPERKIVFIVETSHGYARVDITPSGHIHYQYHYIGTQSYVGSFYLSLNSVNFLCKV